MKKEARLKILKEMEMQRRLEEIALLGNRLPPV